MTDGVTAVATENVLKGIVTTEMVPFEGGQYNARRLCWSFVARNCTHTSDRNPELEHHCCIAGPWLYRRVEVEGGRSLHTAVYQAKKCMLR
jgi:hypothetical protein